MRDRDELIEAAHRTNSINVVNCCVRVLFTDTDPTTPDVPSTDADSALYTGLLRAALSLAPDGVVHHSFTDALGMPLLDHSEAGGLRLARMVLDRSTVEEAIHDSYPENTYYQWNKAGKLYMSPGGGRFWLGNTTRDQLTGVLFGIAAAEGVAVGELYTRLIRTIVSDGYKLLMRDGGHAPSAYKLDAALREIVNTIIDPSRPQRLGPVWPRHLCASTWHYNRWPTRRFVWQLRLMQAATLRLLGYDTRDWSKRCMAFVEQDGNPMFEALHALAMNPHATPRGQFSPAAQKNLERAGREPCGGYFRWEKHPDEWWTTRKDKIGPAMDIWVPRVLMGEYK